MKAQDTPPPAPKKPVANKATCLTPKQIADRLHDDALQSLSGARLLLSVARKQLPQDAADARQQLKSVDEMLDESCKELCALMKELRTAPEKDSAAIRLSPAASAGR